MEISPLLVIEGRDVDSALGRLRLQENYITRCAVQLKKVVGTDTQNYHPDILGYLERRLLDHTYVEDIDNGKPIRSWMCLKHMTKRMTNDINAVMLRWINLASERPENYCARLVTNVGSYNVFPIELYAENSEREVMIVWEIY